MSWRYNQLKWAISYKSLYNAQNESACAIQPTHVSWNVTEKKLLLNISRIRFFLIKNVLNWPYDCSIRYSYHWPKPYIVTVKWWYTYISKHQHYNEYEYTHWLIIYVCRRSDNTPGWEEKKISYHINVRY